MKIVAENLENAVVLQADQKSKALFIRSAFNRYYYDCHISIRSEVKTLLPLLELYHGSKIGTQLHSSYKKKIRDKLGLAGDDVWEKATANELDALIKVIASSATKLYSARQLADYDDNASIVEDGTQYTISESDGKNKFSLEEAKNHLSAIDNCLNQIQVIKSQVGLI